LNHTIICPACASLRVKLNGHIHNGKQNYLCRDCGRQFVLNPTQKRVSEAEKEMINKLLLEKIPLAGISRVVGVSQLWLQGYISNLYQTVPDDLGVDIPVETPFEQRLTEQFNTYVEDELMSKKKR
jgi:transposase-like protein